MSPVVVVLDRSLANVTAISLAGYRRALNKAKQPVPPGLVALETALRTHVAQPICQGVPLIWPSSDDGDCLMKVRVRRRDAAELIGVSQRTISRRLAAVGFPRRAPLHLHDLEWLAR